MSNDTSKTGDRPLKAQTQLVRGGLMRSQFEETSEALYLNSGYVYDTAEEAEMAFTGEKPRYVYSRYANPTLSMLEERIRLLEGAEVCRATASGMAAISVNTENRSSPFKSDICGATVERNWGVVAGCTKMSTIPSQPRPSPQTVSSSEPVLY